MNLGDPELELIDPTPNVHILFLHFDKLFFWTKLSSRAVVRWSKKMYSCAGVCAYEGRGGLCDIALSEPLLKLRPRKDLIETLLHEMIHAFLFITNQDRERDGHGPTFQSHMHRINNAAGLNITIYHDFHDEVELYLTHWWRCNGPCQKRKPYFGVVRKSQNKAPGPSDFWWTTHQRSCGGTFVKIKEPQKQPRKNATKKPNADITKYINNNIIVKNIKTINNLPKDDRKPLTQIQKNSSNIPATSIKSNNGQTVVVTQKGGIYSPKVKNSSIPILFAGKGHTIDGGRKRSNSVDVTETVRQKWASKFANTNNDTGKGKELSRNNTIIGNTNISKTGKHKIPTQSDSTPTKMLKIDDYFKSTATTVLKDIYGQDFKIIQSNNDKKMRAVPLKSNLVDCPICSSKIDSNLINSHLDECLNKDIIQELSQSNPGVTQNPALTEQPEKQVFEEIIASSVTKLKNEINVYPKVEKDFKTAHSSSNVSIDLTNIQFGNASVIKKEPIIKEVVNLTFDPVDVNKVKSIVKKIHFDKHIRKSDNFIVPKEESIKTETRTGLLPSFLDNVATEIRVPSVKIEPGTSKEVKSAKFQKCPCCNNEVDKPMAEHLDECLSFFNNNTTIPEEGASTSFANDTIVIDDEDDIFDETMTLNATGTKTPCPCCMKMIEADDMNSHLDDCLILN